MKKITIKAYDNEIDGLLMKRKILKTASEKRHITFRGTKIRIVADFSSETMQVRRNRPMPLKY